jgi:hypothetical protein
MVTEIATLEENPAFQLKAAELKKYWRTLRGLKFEIDSLASRRKTVAVQIAETGASQELRASFDAILHDLRLAQGIDESFQWLQQELYNEIYRTFGMGAAGPAVAELNRKWEHAVQHGL